jgi:hypothetical protein
VRGELDKKWLAAIEQLRTVKKEVQGFVSDKGAIRLAILFVVHYTSKEMSFAIDEIEEQHKKVSEELSKRPHWEALFHANKKYWGPFEYENSNEYHPAMSIYAFAYKIQRLC